MKPDMLRIFAAMALIAISVIPQPPTALGQAVGRQQAQKGVVSATPAASRRGNTAVLGNGRRDLFAPPPSAVLSGTGGTGASVQLPPMPIPESSGPTVPPTSLPTLPTQGQGKGAQAPPVLLRGIVLGATPQAVLVSNGAYKIVTIGQETPWGTVRTITATTVALETSAGQRTLTFDMRPQPSKATTTGGNR